MMPGDHGLVDTEGAQALDQVEVVGGIEEELRDREVGGAQLLGGVTPIGLAVRRARVRFGVRGDPHREVADATDQLHQLDRVVQLAGREVEVLGRVTPQGEDVVDAGVAVADDDVDQLGARVRGTGEMGHRGHRRVGVDRDDEVVGAFAGGAAGAVGDRDVRRLERLEIAQRLREHAPPSSRRAAGRTRTRSSDRSSGSR